MFERIYEIRLNGRDIKLDRDTWDTVRECAREHEFFFVEYLGEYYKYKHSHTFYERPTRFDFELATPEDAEIKIIHVSE